jgi:2-amino-4-hydroxy-6-hydroxymethyldihydropteridine diphosphokinase
MKQLKLSYLALGSNIGDRQNNLQQAIGLLEQTVSVLKVSRYYRSKAVTPTLQLDYFNCAVLVSSAFSPEKLLEQCKSIEKKMGRLIDADLKPRTIDIDILLFENEQRNSPKLIIPHPRMLVRDFVLKPLLDIIPSSDDRYDYYYKHLNNQPCEVIGALND